MYILEADTKALSLERTSNIEDIYRELCQIYNVEIGILNREG